MSSLTKFHNKLSKISYIEKSLNANWSNEDTAKRKAWGCSALYNIMQWYKNNLPNILK